MIMKLNKSGFCFASIIPVCSWQGQDRMIKEMEADLSVFVG